MRVRLLTHFDGAAEQLQLTRDGSSVVVSPSSGSATQFELTQGVRVADYQAVLRRLAYSNTADEPTPGTRVVEIEAVDPSDAVARAYAHIDIQFVNDAPQLTGGPAFVTVFIEHGSPVPVVNATALSLTDSDSTRFTAVRLGLTQVLNGVDEMLQVPNVSTPTMVVADRTIPGEVVYTVRPAAANTLLPTAQVVELLQGVRFAHQGDEPDVGTRIVTVSVWDDQGAPAQAQTRLEVRQINDNDPVFQPFSQSFSVYENVPLGTVVDVVNVVDLDKAAFGEFTVRIDSIAPASASPPFALVSPHNQTLVVTGSLDRERVSGYLVQLTANDTGGRTQTGRVNIQILDVNDNTPAIVLPPFVFEVDENTPGSVALVRAEDPDDEDLTYSLVTPGVPFRGEPAARGLLFSLVPTINLNRELQDRYDFEIMVRDSGTPSRAAYANVTVHVRDVNDNAPELVGVPATITLAEDTRVGTPVLQLAATDADLDPVIRFAVSNGPLAVDAVTGLVTLAQPLDREMTDTYSLVVTASNPDTPLATDEALTLVVADVNDNAPAFLGQPLDFAVTETNQTQQLVATVQVQDADLLENATAFFRLAGGDPDGIFTVNWINNTAFVRNTLPIDREQHASFNQTLLAVDLGQPPQQTRAFVHITVNDVNDVHPRFEVGAETIQVNETTPAGTVLFTAAADDADAGEAGRVTYHLVGGSTPLAAALFSVDAATGVVRLTDAIDDEAYTAHVLTIEARDHGQPSLTGRLTLTVEVVDYNDNAPVLPFPADMRLALPEDAPVGTVVATLRATDRDSGANAEVRYALTSAQVRTQLCCIPSLAS